MRYILLALAMSGMTVTAMAQQVPGFRDYEVAIGQANANPKYLLHYNGKLYFYGSDGTTGREPHVVGTDGKVLLIQNMAAVGNACISNNYAEPNAGMNNKYYFTATDGGTGEELFSYDGTGNPKLVADLTLGPDSSRPDHYQVVNNKLYFTATLPATGRELYVYDGSTTPQMLPEVNPGTGNGASGPMRELNGLLYFTGTTTAKGSELWSYNPGNNTTALVADIDTGMASSNPANLTVIDGKLYFSANTFDHGRELYVYDGVTAPKRLGDIYPGPLSGVPVKPGNAFVKFNNKVYFSARDIGAQYHLWSYDGTNVAQEVVLNLNGDTDPAELVLYNNKLFFTANDGTHGYELFEYDGANAPVLVGDLCPGAGGSQPQELTVVGDNLFFAASNCGSSGVELFAYNHKKVSVSKVAFDADIKVYPNPATSVLNIAMSLKQEETLAITLYDVSGKIVYHLPQQQYAAGSHNVQVPVHTFAPGTYMYTIAGADGLTRVAGKVLKQ